MTHFVALLGVLALLALLHLIGPVGLRLVAPEVAGGQPAQVDGAGGRRAPGALGKRRRR